jgi:SAM-dependent methyltransferase
VAPLEEVPCARCGGSERRARFFINGWRIVDCRRCGLRFVSPRMPPSAYATFYDPAYYKSSDSLRRGYEDYAAEHGSIVRTFERRWRRLARHATRPLAGGRYLDVGCAYGYALEVAQAAGMEAFGVDVSAHAVREARSRDPA